MNKYPNHYEETSLISASPAEVFNFADNHKNLSLHMNKSSLMMGGASMKTELDGGKGQKIGSHIKMHGKIFGFNLFLDEVISKYSPPYYKEWETVGNINLLVIDHYKLGFEIKPEEEKSLLKVYIDYNLPKPFFTKVLGLFFGDIYAKWCVKQMINGVASHFNNIEK